jgi:hypothetical protein
MSNVRFHRTGGSSSMSLQKTSIVPKGPYHCKFRQGLFTQTPMIYDMDADFVPPIFANKVPLWLADQHYLCYCSMEPLYCSVGSNVMVSDCAPGFGFFCSTEGNLLGTTLPRDIQSMWQTLQQLPPRFDSSQVSTREQHTQLRIL